MDALPDSLHAVVLVEGISDRLALEALAERRGRDLVAGGVTIVPIGGAQAIGRFLDELGPRRRDVRLAGLCDAPEERHFRRALERAGFGSDLDRRAMERLGFMPSADRRNTRYPPLLVRALDPDRVPRPLAGVLARV